MHDAPNQTTNPTKKMKYRIEPKPEYHETAHP